ncbi:MAG TPA: hypothetical protein VKU88_11270 [Acidimicrobiales bacterium]|nr:hypothetical protein [Acidimicrobiales bacterium]
MVVAVTPGEVAPPLLPEKVVQGGEYGSPGTCGPVQVPTLPGVVVVPPPPPPPELDPPEEAMAPEWVAAAAGEAFGEEEEALGPADPLLADWAEGLPEADALATVVLGTLLGTSQAMSTMITANTASGP